MSDMDMRSEHYLFLRVLDRSADALSSPRCQYDECVYIIFYSGYFGADSICIGLQSHAENEEDVEVEGRGDRSGGRRIDVGLAIMHSHPRMESTFSRSRDS